MMSSKKTKVELVAENENLRSRLAELEQNATPEPSMPSGTPGKSGMDMEQALSESKLRLAEILDVAQEAIVSIDENQKILLFNKGAERIFGLKEKDAIGQALEVLLPEAARSIHHQHLENFSRGSVTSQQMSKRVEILGRRKTGELFPAEASISKVEVAGRQVFTAFLRDITERKEIQSELHLLSEVVKNMVGGVGLMRFEDRTVIFANPTFEKIFGYESGELLGKNVVTLNASDDKTPEEIAEEVLRGIEEKKWWQGEVHNVKKDGTPFWTSAYVSEVEHPQFGAVMLAVLHDITEQKLIENQLRQSQKIQAIGTLAGGVAHDFNNILTPILGYSQMLMENVDSRDEDRAYANFIFRSAERAKELVSQILLFSRHDQTEQKIVDLCPLTLDVVEFVRSTLSTSINVDCEISPDSASVICDPSQIYQVIVNLCVNAEQAIPGNGEIKIVLEAVELDNFRCIIGKVLSGKYVRIAVTDNGIGMDEEVIGHLFEPFYTTKPVGKGTGLGLSIVFGIVQTHGGGLTVSSKPGKGTTVEIFLPLIESTIEKLPDSSGRIQPTGTENILFVDDEEAIRDLAKISLQRLGYKTTIVADGQQALELFTENPERFDLVVTDQTMPNMTGAVLANLLLKIRPGIPIILCTGHSAVISPKSSEAMGISRFLYKPITPTGLGRVVREELDMAKNDHE